MKYFEVIYDDNELCVFRLKDNSLVFVPKEQLKFKPLSLEELKEMKGADDEQYSHSCRHNVQFIVLDRVVGW